MQAHLAEARIHVQIDVGFGDAITPAATDMNFPTLLDDMASPNVLAYPNETIVAEKAEAIVDPDMMASIQHTPALLQASPLCNFGLCRK